jgi:hypothetical protein
MSEVTPSLHLSDAMAGGLAIDQHRFPIVAAILSSTPVRCGLVGLGRPSARSDGSVDKLVRRFDRQQRRARARRYIDRP